MSGRTISLSSSRRLVKPARRTPSVKSLLIHLETRARLAVAVIGLSVLVIFAATRLLDVYSTAYQLFDTVGQTSSIRVDASEQALQHIAGASTSAADFSNPVINAQGHQTALAAVYDQFALFRTDLFTLHADLDSSEQATFDKLENAVYNEFWPQIVLNIANQQSGNAAAARDAYVKADGYLKGDITRTLQQIETDNFNAMKAAEQQAGWTIVTQSLLLGVILLALAIGLTVLSFWLRYRVRRLLTPGLDAAAVIAWLLLIVTLVQLLQLPEALRSMVEDAYYSVTASSRVLAAASQGNRAESGGLLDSDHVASWQQDFDADKLSIELRLCGQAGCTQTPFAVSDTVLPAVLMRAKAISQTDSNTIGGVVPLVANVTYVGEAQALETARIAYRDYLAIDTQMRAMIQNKQLTQAWVIDTGTQPGQSDEAYSRFTAAMTHEKAINRAVFDQLWRNEQAALPGSRIAFGLVGTLLLIGLLAVGIAQRYREL